ncbi:MAG: NAD(P)/FAD-dependent oxidoreductase [Bdellovibrionales bacterium]|nr:NAD(P)/FAD-dependent oxidoreductase [Bdellovibrionales bacterium]
MQRAIQPHRVVVVGGGFGGLEVTRALHRAPIHITLIDRRNFHLFQPLLYQVATGSLSPANIAAPLRSVLRRQRNCTVLLGEVGGVDPRRHRLVLDDDELPFDTLVLAAGATHSYFGRSEWATAAPGLKTLEDAIDIRRRIYVAFETAERESDPLRREHLLTFVIIGGGPTGTELAGALAEICRYTLRRDFRVIRPRDARIILLDAGERLLPSYSPRTSEQTSRTLRNLGVQVGVGCKVLHVDATGVDVATPDGRFFIHAETVLWAAGVEATPLGRKIAAALTLDVDPAGRLPVLPDLSLPGYPDIFAIGDMAHCRDERGSPLPGLAPVAQQQGRHVARLIRNRCKGQTKAAPFRYANRGTMATVGRGVAAAQVGNYTSFGFFAWLLWLFVHLLQIVQFQNRVLVLLQWSWSYITWNRSARLITNMHPVERRHQRAHQLDQHAGGQQRESIGRTARL